MILQNIVIISVLTLLALKVGVSFEHANSIEKSNIRKNKLDVDSIYTNNPKLDLKMNYYELTKSQ